MNAWIQNENTISKLQMHITTNPHPIHSHYTYSQVLSQLYLMILPTYLRLYIYDSNNSIMMKYKMYNYILHKTYWNIVAEILIGSPHISLKLYYSYCCSMTLYLFCNINIHILLHQSFDSLFSSRQYFVLSCDIFCSQN